MNNVRVLNKPLRCIGINFFPQILCGLRDFSYLCNINHVLT